MNSYYLLSWKHKKELASAFYAIKNQVAHELMPELDGKNSLPFNFQLGRVREKKDGLTMDGDLTDLKETWLDYQPNSLAWPLISERLKYLIEINLTGNEQVGWINCKVESEKEEKPYFVLRFNKMLDVLDMKKTMFVPGTDHIIKPVFAVSKISAYSIFSMPSSHNLWKITSGLYISETLKKAIQKQKLTGLDFQKVSVA
ncbi:imm11 family protein [Pedobacter immunditicola]|uniref:imm11 family protein n=1 Tax=Pedobacter immunditicola TaxID=3133440 RepID=UPI003098290E